jgi:SAM-dependent methyltransferase
MSRWYRFLYRVGFKPWEQDAPNVAPELRALLDREEASRKPPYGPALDLGCGTGNWSVELARRGWEVVGIDVVPKAIAGARKRAQAAGVEVAFVRGDVTTLRDAGIGSGFSFFLDVECFNHLTDAQRLAVGHEVNAVAAPDATMLLLVWARARRGPFPPGASRDDLTTAFPGWRIVDEHRYEGALPRPLKNIAPQWYRLARMKSDEAP